MTQPCLTIESVEHLLVPRLSLAHCSWTEGLQGDAAAVSDWTTPSGSLLRALAVQHGARGPDDFTLRISFFPSASADALRPGDIISPA